MQVIPLNHIDPAKIPASVKTDLCSGAIALVMRHRNDPGYQERFKKWLAEQKNKSA